MQWWCSASSQPWTWTPVAYPGIWIVELSLAIAYWRLSRSSATPRRALWAGWLGVTLLSVALDWPVGPLAAGYLATAHAIQFLIVALIAPALMLLGARHGIVNRWPRSPGRALDIAFHPLLAAVFFNVVVIATHVPGVNDALMPTQLGAFAIDFAWLAAGVLLWWPLIVPVPSRPRFVVPFRMLYFFLATLAHSGIAIVMLVRDHPMYGIYELAPRVMPLSAMNDLQTAGALMELGGGAVIFGVLTVMFFRWSGGTGAERTHPIAPTLSR